MNNESKIIVAFDDQTENEIKRLSYGLKDLVYGYKVNSALIAQGPALLDRLARYGNKVMADLKLFDIPNTMKNYITHLLSRDVDIITVHMSANFDANAWGLDASKNLAGVTVLTSFNDNQCQETYKMDILTRIEEFANLAVQFKYGYLVCSGEDLENRCLVEMVKKANIKIICPGIRLEDDEPDDQIRTKTPKEAIDLGADFVILGRCLLKYSENLYKLSEIITSINSL